jgi:hypothetical protein
MATGIPRSARRTTQRGRHVAAGRWVLAARAGYVARGVLYGVMGLLALGIALGAGGRAVDQRGGLVFLAGNVFGRAVLFVFIVALAGYAAWGFVRAIYDPLGRGSDASGIVQRLAYLWSGLTYAALVWFALQLFGGGSNVDVNGDTVQAFVATLLRNPAGGTLTVGAGLLAIGAGIVQFVEARRGSFRRDLKRSQMSSRARRYSDFLGQYGLMARGVTFVVVGWFLVQAGLSHDPAQAHGYSGAFAFILQQPFGRVLLGVTAAGFVALGLHSFICARWMRLTGGRG